MAETDDQDDKTEDPTGRRLEQAAEKGDIPRSMEISTWFVLAGGTLALMIAGGSSSQTLALAMRGMLGNAHTIPTDGAGLMTFGSAAILTTLGAIARCEADGTDASSSSSSSSSSHSFGGP
jgi:flagellar biosynthetic protein FlhB